MVGGTRRSAARCCPALTFECRPDWLRLVLRPEPPDAVWGEGAPTASAMAVSIIVRSWSAADPGGAQAVIICVGTEPAAIVSVAWGLIAADP
jgi:hypothetical protein